MTTVFALRDAANDEALRGAPLAIYLYLVTNLLDPVELRSVKISGLAYALRMKRHTITRGLRVLILNGYLERKYMGHEGYHYRVYQTKRKQLGEVA